MRDELALHADFANAFDVDLHMFDYLTTGLDVCIRAPALGLLPAELGLHRFRLNQFLKRQLIGDFEHFCSQCLDLRLDFLFDVRREVVDIHHEHRWAL